MMRTGKKIHDNSSLQIAGGLKTQKGEHMPSDYDKAAEDNRAVNDVLRAADPGTSVRQAMELLGMTGPTPETRMKEALAEERMDRYRRGIPSY
jgi:hypothetical protein